MTKRVIVVDDEPGARLQLRSVLASIPEFEVVAEAGDGRSAIAAIEKLRPDVVFLDIEMPELNGFDVAVATSHINYHLVFVTAYERYALRAFDTFAIDYLLKPARPSMVEKCANKILHQEQVVLESLSPGSSEDATLLLTEGSTSRVISEAHIRFIEGIGRYRRIHLTSEGSTTHRISTIISDTTLDEFSVQLEPAKFMRVHRSFIVNLPLIVSLQTQGRRLFAQLAETDITIPIARAKAAELRSRLG